MFSISFLYEIPLPITMAKEKSCGAVVFKRHKEGLKYLVLHYAAGHWDFPKGKQEKNEKEEQTALREIKEETGIEDAEIVDGFREEIKYFYKKDEETIYKEVVFFLAETGAEEIKLSFEHIGYAWLSYEHAHKKLAFNNAKELLSKAEKFLHERNS